MIDLCVFVSFPHIPVLLTIFGNYKLNKPTIEGKLHKESSIRPLTNNKQTIEQKSKGTLWLDDVSGVHVFISSVYYGSLHHCSLFIKTRLIDFLVESPLPC